MNGTAQCSCNLIASFRTGSGAGDALYDSSNTSWTASENFTIGLAPVNSSSIDRRGNKAAMRRVAYGSREILSAIAVTKRVSHPHCCLQWLLWTEASTTHQSMRMPQAAACLEAFAAAALQRLFWKQARQYTQHTIWTSPRYTGNLLLRIVYCK